MKKERQISDEMLAKYLLGEVSEAEQKEVEEWIGENDLNKNEFDTYNLIWEQSGQMKASSIIDTDDAWAKFKLRTDGAVPAARSIPLSSNYRWLKVAALALLFVGAGWLAMNQYSNGNHYFAEKNQSMPVKAGNTSLPKPVSTPINPSPLTDDAKPVVIKKTNSRSISADQREVDGVRLRKHLKSIKNYYTRGTISKSKINGFICNSTPYPFEICIIQSVKCNNDRPSAVSTCSVLEPDQSGQLRYKAFNKIARNCKATIEEITITKITTGETIVLNNHSTPTTAQNFFNHITGKKKGDVMAGMFHCDVDNLDDDCSLTFDSNFGNLSMQ